MDTDASEPDSRLMQVPSWETTRRGEGEGGKAAPPANFNTGEPFLRFQSFGSQVGPGRKVLLPRWVLFAKKWRRKLPVTQVPGLPWNLGLGLGQIQAPSFSMSQLPCRASVHLCGTVCVQVGRTQLCGGAHSGNLSQNEMLARPQGC